MSEPAARPFDVAVPGLEVVAVPMPASMARR